MTMLVTGATGRIGRRVIDRLLQEGSAVRALTRDAQRAADLPAGVEVVAGDLERPETLAAAFEGVTGAHLITIGGGDYRPLSTGAEIVELAERAGVRRVTVLWRGERGSVEEAVTSSGLEWTLLEATEFMSNALQWAPSIAAEGVVREPYATSRAAVVDPDDVADMAAEILLRGGHGGATLVPSGPESLTVPQRVEALARALGREIAYVELSDAEARERWRREGQTDEHIALIAAWLGDPPAAATTVTGDVERVLGRPARTFADWAQAHAAEFRAPVSAAG